MLRAGEPTRHWRAHCAAFALDHDLPTAEMVGVNVLHTCDNPPCCEPSHLFVGTQAVNQADKVAKGRQARGDGHWTRQPEYAALLSDVNRRRRAHQTTAIQLKGPRRLKSSRLKMS